MLHARTMDWTRNALVSLLEVVLGPDAAAIRPALSAAGPMLSHAVRWSVTRWMGRTRRALHSQISETQI